MPNPPNNPNASDHLRPKKLAVYIADDSESKPTENQERYGFHVLEIRRGVNEQTPVAHIAVDLGLLGTRIENEFLTEEMNRRVEIWQLKDQIEEDDESPRERCLFSGEILAMDVQLSSQGGNFQENRVLIASVPDYHFGDLIRGQESYNYILDDVETIARDLEFNPVVDVERINNMIDSSEDKNPQSYSLWIDPEATHTSNSTDNYHGANTEWTLIKAIETICAIGNPDETFIKNPSVEHMEEVFGEEPPELKDVTIPRGFRVPQYLSALLNRYGYGWYLGFEEDGEGNTYQTIILYKQGDGAQKTLKLDEIDADLDMSKNNVDQISFTYDVSRLANKLYLYGAFRQLEVTLELYRGWDPNFDGVVDGSEPDSAVGRLWIANEGGDYKGLRSEIPTDPPDIFSNNTNPRKRVIDDCLTYLEGTNTRRVPIVEYSLDDGSTWREFNSSDGISAGITVLPNEIGIWLTDPVLSVELHATNTEELRIRITGTVTDDVRINYGTDDDNDTPNSNTIERLVDVSDQFKYRLKALTGPYASITGNEPADLVNDQDALETEADKLLDLDKAAQIQASVRLPQIVHDYKEGDIITEVEGRSISFNRYTSGSGNKRYLQVVGIEFSNAEANQSTQLRMEPYDV